MPSHVRGKLKEHMEGVHRNCEAIKDHCRKSLNLIGNENERVTQGLEAIATIAQQVDDIVLGMYSNI